jgi:hypothetical protein
MAYANRPFTVIGHDGFGQTTTHCASLQGAVRSAKGFAPSFTSLVICHNGEVVKVIR